MEAGRTEELPRGAGRTEELPRGAGRTEELPMGAGRTEELPMGAGRSEALPTGAGRTEELPMGAGRKLRQMIRLMIMGRTTTISARGRKFHRCPPSLPLCLSTSEVVASL